MCTISWFYSSEGYQVFCNRDEKRTRKRAEKPCIAEAGGVRYVAPIDGDRGGSWIATNEYGVTLALLNGAPAASPGRVSRGLLVLQAAAAISAADARARVREARFDAFAPFVLVAFDLATDPRLVEWTGTGLIEKSACAHMPLASSSYDPDGIRALRRRQFTRISDRGISARSLTEFHSSHESGPSAYSPCMHRPDAATVSFSRVDVSRVGATFFYSPAAPCMHARGVTVTLPLRPQLARVA